MSNKKVLSLLGVAALSAGVLSACGGGNEKVDLGGQTIRFAFPGAEGRDPRHENSEFAENAEELAEWEEKYNFKFEVVEYTADWDNIPDEIIKSVMAGEPVAEFLEFTAQWLPTLVAADALEPIDAKMLKEIGLPEQEIQNATWVGESWGRGRGSCDQSLVYNIDLLQDAGIEKMPTQMFIDGEWNYDGFYELLKTLNSNLPEGKYPMYIDPYYFALYMIPANGGSIISQDGTVGFLDDKSVEALDFMKKVWDSGFIRPADVLEDGSSDYWGSQAAFPAGDVALTHAASWQMTGFVDNMNWGMVPYPYGPSVKSEADYKTMYYDGRVNVVPKGTSEKVDPKFLYELYDMIYTVEEDETKEPWGSAFLNTEDELKLFQWIQEPEVCKFEAAPSLGISFGSVVRDIAENKKPVRGTLEAHVPTVEARLNELGIKAAK